MPQGRHVGGEGFELGPGWQRWHGGLRWVGERLLGLGEGGQTLLPAGFEVAGDQPVLRFAGVEGPLGPVGFVAGPFHGQLGGPAAAGPAVGDLVGGGQRQRDLVGVEGVQEPFGHGVVDGGGGDRPAGGRRHLVGAGGRALVGGVAVAVVAGGHRPPAGAAADDPLTQGVALARRAGAGVGRCWRPKPGPVGQVVVPADVAGVVVVDDHRPLVAGQLDELGAHRPVGATTRRQW